MERLIQKKIVAIAINDFLQLQNPFGENYGFIGINIRTHASNR